MTHAFEAITRLTRDQRAAAKHLGRREARWLVDTYYQLQRDRIRSTNQERALSESHEPNAALSWLSNAHASMEEQIKGALAKYVESDPVGRWCLSIHGIGPVITAGFLSRLEIRPTAGAWWRYCGLDPSVEWKKGQKCPWNMHLRKLCYLAGESFVKTSGSEKSYYGKIYQQRKAQETEKNERGEFAEQAARQLATRRYGKDTEAYKELSSGRLPKAQIHARARRYAVKIFLSHLHHVMYETEHGTPPPKPYAIDILSHAHYVGPPNWPMQE